LQHDEWYLRLRHIRATLLTAAQNKCWKEKEKYQANTESASHISISPSLYRFKKRSEREEIPVPVSRLVDKPFFSVAGVSAVKLTLPIIIILDEVGYLTLDKTASDHLFQLITRAYENVALIITWLNSYNLRLGLLVIQVEKGD
jgi:hypothetical protein